MSKTSPLKEKTFAFAVRAVKLYQYLVEEKKEYTLGKQVLRSGTNPGAMVREAFNAESPKDFIHKLSIGQKEIGETIYWLELLEATNYISKKEFDSLNADATEVMKLLRSTIITRKKKLGILSITILVITASTYLLWV